MGLSRQQQVYLYKDYFVFKIISLEHAIFKHTERRKFHTKSITHSPYSPSSSDYQPYGSIPYISLLSVLLPDNSLPLRSTTTTTTMCLYSSTECQNKACGWTSETVLTLCPLASTNAAGHKVPCERPETVVEKPQICSPLCPLQIVVKYFADRGY